MATLKLKKSAGTGSPAKTQRAPVRGTTTALKKRPTLSEAQALRDEREARYQEQLRLRYGDRQDGRPPAPPAGRGRPDPRPDTRPPARRADTEGRDDRRPRRDDRVPPGRPDPRGRRDERPPYGQQDARGRRDTRPPLEPARPVRPGQNPTGPRGPNSAFGGGRSNNAFGERQNNAFGDRQKNASAGGPNTAFGKGPQPAFGPRGAHGPSAHKPPARPRARPRDDEDDDFDDAHTQNDVPGSMRLSKRMSELGIASRREADEWIPKGWVRVDGKVVTELGSRVMPGQLISIEAKARDAQALKVTVLIHKPVGYVSGQAEDGYEPASVLVTPQNQWREDRSGVRFLQSHHRGLAPAGRLDIDSTGLLVLTQDGRIAKQLIGEDSEIEKEYLVRVESVDGQPLPPERLELLRHGLELDGEPLRPAQVEWVNDDQLRFVLREGKKRQIRRMCEAVGLKVVGLKRVRIGQVMLGDLPPGQWRYLRGMERFG